MSSHCPALKKEAGMLSLLTSGSGDRRCALGFLTAADDCVCAAVSSPVSGGMYCTAISVAHLEGAHCNTVRIESGEGEERRGARQRVCEDDVCESETGGEIQSEPLKTLGSLLGKPS